jgi:cytosine deaminase
MTTGPLLIGLLRGGSLPDGRVVDVAIANGVVQAVGTPGTVEPGPGEVLDVGEHVLLPAPAEPHAHLDKALTWDAIEPPAGDLRRAIESFRAFSEQEPEPAIEDRAVRALERMLASGTTAVRSHVNFFGGDDPLRAFRALSAARSRFEGLVQLQLVALPGWDTPTALVERAMQEGADLVGGAPHLAPDPLADLDRLLDLAERLGCPVDLHTDEGLDGPLTLAAYAERTRDWPVGRSAGHCVRLGTLPEAELAPVVDAVRAADIGVISLPITNLYLQGWQTPVATPRGITALRALLDAGVRVAGGADNLRDPFNPMGRGDALETASLLVTAGHLSVAEAVHAVTNGARSVLGLPDAGPVPGAVADLLAVRGATLAEAVAFAPADRFVLAAGRLVASTSTVTTIAASTAGTEVRL